MHVSLDYGTHILPFLAFVYLAFNDCFSQFMYAVAVQSCSQAMSSPDPKLRGANTVLAIFQKSKNQSIVLQDAALWMSAMPWVQEYIMEQHTPGVLLHDKAKALGMSEGGAENGEDWRARVAKASMSEDQSTTFEELKRARWASHQPQFDYLTKCFTRDASLSPPWPSWVEACKFNPEVMAYAKEVRGRRVYWYAILAKFLSR